MSELKKMNDFALTGYCRLGSLEVDFEMEISVQDVY